MKNEGGLAFLGCSCTAPVVKDYIVSPAEECLGYNE